jgi:hypothetical protein
VGADGGRSEGRDAERSEGGYDVLARSLPKVCKATDGDGFTDYRVMDGVQACIGRENGLAHAARHGHKKGKKS